jgi:hypothetical protein
MGQQKEDNLGERIDSAFRACSKTGTGIKNQAVRRRSTKKPAKSSAGLKTFKEII